MESDYSAAQALTDAAQSREQMASRLKMPSWYYPALGVSEALLVVVVGLPLAGWWLGARVALLFVVAIAFGSLIGTYQKHTGIKLTIRNSGHRSRPLWVALIIIIVACLAIALMNAVAGGIWLIVAGCALVTFTGFAILGPRIDAALERDIRDGSSSHLQA